MQNKFDANRVAGPTKSASTINVGFQINDKKYENGKSVFLSKTQKSIKNQHRKKRNFQSHYETVQIHWPCHQN